jgi:AcrR family transcriptional regulator
VMAASGVSKSQLYHYFADKDALVLEVVALQAGRVLAAFSHSSARSRAGSFCPRRPIQIARWKSPSTWPSTM